ncbi:MAG: DedA family protein [Candidatus Spechtbacterales bacterium]|nr:DedA family protein [Candidatus Spechtbacterales bacterium]
MIGTALAWLSSKVILVIESTGYAGVFVLMALEGSFIPVPSEIILPFSGFLVFKGEFSLFAVALVGALGNIAGTVFTYSVSRFFGASFLYKYGKYFLVSHRDIDMANKLFKDHGVKIIFISRLIPGIRGFIPIPAGIAKMKFIPFVLYVFTGSFIYSLVLTYVGVWGGENWDWLSPYFKQFDWVLLVLMLWAATWWVRRHFRHNKELKNEK